MHTSALLGGSQGASNSLNPGGVPFLPLQHASLGQTLGEGPGTPTRQSQFIPPSVIISPSVPVGLGGRMRTVSSVRVMANCNCHSIFQHLDLRKPCLTILLLRSLEPSLSHLIG